MSINSEPLKTWNSLRQNILGLGEKSLLKNSCPGLQMQLGELSRFRDLLGQTGEAILIAEFPGGKLVDANDSACAYVNCTVKDLLELNLKNILTKEVLNQIGAYVNRNENSSENNRLNLPLNTVLYTREGWHFPVELNYLHVNLNKSRFILLVARSLQERERAEQALRELDAIAAAAKSLRNIKTKAEILPLILEQIFNLLPIKGAAFAFPNRVSGEMVVEEAAGAWTNWNGWRFPSSAEISAKVYKTGEPFFTNRSEQDPNIFSTDLERSITHISCLPLMAEEQTCGVLWVGAEDNLSNGDLRTLTAISEIVASALYQASLHEQTQRRVQRMAALRSIDMTITASLDLQVTLEILLSQVISHLNVDAATVLLYKNTTRTLDYANAIGFKTPHVKQTSLNLGEAFAGQAALERRIVHIPSLEHKSLPPLFSNMLKAEHFSSYMASPLIAKGEVKGILEIFHCSPLNPDAEWMDFLEALSMQAAIAIDNAELFNSLQRSNMELTMAYDNTLEGWVRTLALRDLETEVHTQRVTMLTLRLAMAMGLPDSSLVHVKRGALLHDIGKLAIPDSILRKAETLNEEEWDLLRQHPTCAAELLAPIPYLAQALDIPYCHHEKWDGSGYPRGLKAEQIPLAARIFAVVDVWDALSTDRPYREAWSQEKVIEYLCDQSGKHFDPRVVESFLLMLETSGETK
jgi:HD-GYP domain-containing protein (c-di-GMP phosphodiesterase class II)